MIATDWGDPPPAAHALMRELGFDYDSHGNYFFKSGVKAIRISGTYRFREEGSTEPLPRGYRVQILFTADPLKSRVWVPESDIVEGIKQHLRQHNYAVDELLRARRLRALLD